MPQEGYVDHDCPEAKRKFCGTSLLLFSAKNATSAMHVLGWKSQLREELKLVESSATSHLDSHSLGITPPFSTASNSESVNELWRYARCVGGKSHMLL